MTNSIKFNKFLYRIHVKTIPLCLLTFFFYISIFNNAQADIEIPMPDLSYNRVLLKTEVNASIQKINKIIKETNFSKDKLPIWDYEALCDYTHLNPDGTDFKNLSIEKRKWKAWDDLIKCKKQEKAGFEFLKNTKTSDYTINICIKNHLADLNYSKIKNCIQEQEKARKEIEAGFEGYEEIMKTICFEDWKGDYKTASICIKNQIRAKNMIEAGNYYINDAIKAKCNKVWTGDYIKYYNCLMPRI